MSVLSPLDLLTVSGNEQVVIRCLIRRPDLTVKEIAKFTKVPLDELDHLLAAMIQDNRLIKSNKNRFQVLLGNSEKSKREQPGTGLLDMLFGG